MPTLTPARALLAELDTAAVKHKLRVLPGLLQSARTEESLAKQALEDAKANVAHMEAALMAEIAEALDDKGKPRYSNIESRKAALERWKFERAECHGPVRGLVRAQATMDAAVVRRMSLDDEFAAARALARLLTAELNLLADEANEH